MTSIEAKLKKLPYEVLVALVADLYERYEDIEEIIDSCLECMRLENESADMDENLPATGLAQQIDRLTSTSHFYNFHEVYLLGEQCENVLQDIADLAEQDTEQALGLLDVLLSRHGQLHECVDDSHGVVGEAMQQAVQLWLQVAAQLRKQQPDARQWVEAVLKYNSQNDYGCFDELISSSRCLLTENELQMLARQFEQQAQVAVSIQRGDEHYNAPLENACLGLRAVAEALQDFDLYEQSLLIKSPVPNTLQLERLIGYALELEEFERARHWLQQPQWQHDKNKHKYLNNQLLLRQGYIDQLKQNLLSDWRLNPHSFTLQMYWEHATRDEKNSLTAELLSRVEQLDSQEETLNMLLFVGEVTVAAEYLVAQQAGLTRCYYSTLLYWLENFERAGQTLAMIICYRLLLLDVLDRGYSRAYHHAARYFNALLKLDKARPDYQGLASAQEFIATLQARHGRKRSFWQEAKYPAKGQPAGSN